jgi:hypothetical protein
MCTGTAVPQKLFSIQFNSICIYKRAGLPAQMTIIRTAQEHKENTKTVQSHKNTTRKECDWLS